VYSKSSDMGRWVASRPARIEEYWSWFAVALFLHVTLDLLTTAGAAARYGLAPEINPLVVWLIGQGTVVLVGAHLVVVVLAATAFAGIVRVLRRMPSPYDRYYAYFVEVWLALVVAAGLVVVTNNLSVIVFGASLL